MQTLCNLKGHTKKLKYVTMLFTKQRAYAQKEFLQFPRDLAHRTRGTSHSIGKFVSIISYFTLLWTTTVLSDKLNISLAPSAGQT